MSKKTNSLLFMLIATVLNLLLLIVLFVLGFIILSFLPIQDNQSLLMLGIAVVFILSIVLSFLLYSKIVKWAIAKFNLEDKMDPLFGKGGKRR